MLSCLLGLGPSRRETGEIRAKSLKLLDRFKIREYASISSRRARLWTSASRRNGARRRQSDPGILLL